ncbi:MAG: FecR domain-containing protein [Fibrobacterota bacterium]
MDKNKCRRISEILYSSGPHEEIEREALIHISECPSCGSVKNRIDEFNSILLSGGSYDISEEEWEETADKAIRISGILKQKNRTKKTPYFFAAAAAVLIFLGIFAFQQSSVSAPDYNTASVIGSSSLGTRIVYDSSTVIDISDDAVLRLASRSGRSMKFVLEKGSALFSVREDYYEAFHVETDRFLCRVIGTVFKIETGEKGASVAVRKGIVYINDSKWGEAVYLKEGMKYATSDDSMAVFAANAEKETDRSDFENWSENREEKSTRRSVAKHPSDEGAALFEKALSFIRKKKYNKAVSLFSKVSAKNAPSFLADEAVYRKNRILINNLGKIRQGIEGLEEYVVNKKSGDWREESLLLLSRAELGRDNFNKSVKWLEIYLRDYPEGDYKASVLYSMATIFNNYLGRREKALEMYRLYASEFPDSENVSGARAWIEKLSENTLSIQEMAKPGHKGK